jgi:integrase
MAHIRTRRHGGGKSYQVRVSVTRNGKREEIARNFASRAEAETWKKDEAARLERHGVQGGRTTVEAYLAQWLETKAAKLGAKTWDEYRYHANRVLPDLGHLRLDRLSPWDIDRCYARLLRAGGKGGKPLDARTVHHVHRILSNALRQACRWRYLAANPAEAAMPPSPPATPCRAPTQAELRAYFQAALPTPFFLPLLVAYWAGLRRSELLALRWQDVELERGRINVRQTAWESRGKYGLKPRPKTKASHRTIDVPVNLVDRLARHKLQQAEDRLRYGASWRADLDLCFCRPGGLLWQPSEFGRRVGLIAQAAGLPTREVRPLHGMRHGFGTDSRRAGVATKVTSVRMGHSSVVITQDTYDHVMPEDEADTSGAEAAAKLEARLLPLLKDIGA